MASDEQIERLIQAVDRQTQAIAGALGGIEEAIRGIPRQPAPPSSRPSSSKQKTAGKL